MLQEQNMELRKQNKKLRKQNKELRTQNTKLKERLEGEGANSRAIERGSGSDKRDDSGTIASNNSGKGANSLDALLRGSVILSAYGKQYYAFVFAPSWVVIYSLSTKAIVYKQYCACRFTSLVSFGNKFYAGLLDGGILVFLKKRGKNFGYIDSRTDGLTNYGDFYRDSIEKMEIKLLACNKKVLVYSTKHELVLLRPKSEPERVPFEHPILKLRINNQEMMLLLVTKEKAGFFLYRLPVEKSWDAHSRVILKLEKNNWDLLALSKNGDVACHQEGSFIIYKPFSGDVVANKILLGNSLKNNNGGSACFVGKDELLFAYCGSKYAEIAFACCELKSKLWGCLGTYQEKELAEWYELEWEDCIGSTIREARFNGNNFVLRIQGHSNQESLLSVPLGDGGIVLDNEFSYLDLNF
ncbi:hypothetical protein BDW02DRAFT_584730 [Decorospora gaudefroyi]|uniref:CNH domain-containing protein n=1 Tax=Decorospora gaudefroyi TaxID=184978 RepID=A0A6A5JV25_9PLEO|nr:hypothetical protein BDW02DRAFT_584730 [Decorospora gaudefroyi]